MAQDKKTVEHGDAAKDIKVATTYNKKVYVIGDKREGVILLVRDPLRVAVLTKERIRTFAQSTNQTDDAVFGKIAAATKKLFIMNDEPNAPPAVDEIYEAFGTSIEWGAKISDVEFCFVATLRDDQWTTNRIPYSPLKNALIQLTTTTSPDDKDVDPVTSQ
jgi:hypothetical protein